jgi:hypothetical protein
MFLFKRPWRGAFETEAAMNISNWQDWLYWGLRIGAITFPFAWGIFEILTRGR